MIYGFENILFEKPENSPGSGDCWTFLVSCWLVLGNLDFEKSYSFSERDVTTGICKQKKKV